MVKDDNIIALLERITGATRHKEIDEQKRLDATIARITGSSQTVADSYRTTPQPGHGLGKYQPKARATGRDTGGVSWYNAAIGDEPTYQLARIHARA